MDLGQPDGELVEEGRFKDVNKNSFAYGQREGDGKCKYKGLFMASVVVKCRQTTGIF